MFVGQLNRFVSFASFFFFLVLTASELKSLLLEKLEKKNKNTLNLHMKPQLTAQQPNPLRNQEDEGKAEKVHL